MYYMVHVFLLIPFLFVFLPRDSVNRGIGWDVGLKGRRRELAFCIDGNKPAC